MHVGARLLTWTAEGLSVATAAAIMVVQSPNLDAADTVNWMLRGLLAVSLALNTYFLKRLSDTVSKCTDKGNEHETRITVLERSYETWLAATREDNETVDRRERKPGRRAGDMARSVKKDRDD